MAINVQGGGLFFDSGIDLATLQQDATKANNILAGIGDKGLTSFTNQVKDQTAQIEALAKKTALSIETLRAKVLARQQFIIQETDIKKIAQYNREIQALETEIGRLSSAGKKGFDEFGNAIPANIAKTTGKLNLLSKGFSFFRQAAFLIPGIGIAGIFNLIGQGVAFLVGKLFDLKGASSVAAANLKNLGEVMKTANQEAGKQIADARLLYDAATNVNLSMKDRLAAVKALKAEFPDFFGQIDQEIILNGKAKKSYDDLVQSIINTSRARAAKAKIDEIEAQRLDVFYAKQKIQVDAIAERAKATDKTIGQITGGVAVGRGGSEQKLSRQAQLQIIQNRENEKIREQERKDMQLDQQEKFLITFTGETKITKVIEDGNKTREALKKAAIGQDKELNDLLNQRISILKLIEGLQHDVVRSGLFREETEIDKLNQKYDEATKTITEFNKKLEEANKKRGIPVATGTINLDQVNNLRAIELTNTRLKQEADAYKNSLEEQAKVFQQFEQAKKDFGVEKANELFAEQRKGFNSNLEFLQAEARKMLPKIQAAFTGVGGVLNIGDLKKIQALFDAIQKAQQNQKEVELANLKDLLSQTADFADKRADIDKKYNTLFETLKNERVRMSEDEYNRRLQALQKNRAEEEQELANSAVRQSDLFKKLGQDTIALSKKQIQEQINFLKEQLRKGIFTDAAGRQQVISPEFRKLIQQFIDQLLGLVHQSDDTSEKLLKTAGEFSVVGDGLQNIGSALEGINEDLGKTISVLGTLASAVGSTLKSVDAFNAAKDTGNIAGQISAIGGIVGTAIGVVSTVVGIFNAAAEKRKQFEREAEEARTRIFLGEIEINELYRQRTLEQVKINKLRLEGIEDEKKLLQLQKQQIDQDFKTILDQLKQLNATPFPGQALNALFTNSLSALHAELSLANKSFDELEKLFMQGRLEGKAKELFEELQKLKQEGIDVDRLLVQNAEDLKQAVTGTTADSIADAILDGFKAGKRGISDFTDTFEDLMRQAILNSLKLKYLEGPLKDFFDQFAAAANSDNTLTQTEIDDLQRMFNRIITNADKQFQDLQRIAGLNITSTSQSQQNTLTGAFRTLTEDTGNVLAGQFAGQRIATIEIRDIQRNALSHLNDIVTNTALTWQEIKAMHSKMEYYFRDQGVKIK